MRELKTFASKIKWKRVFLFLSTLVFILIVIGVVFAGAYLKRFLETAGTSIPQIRQKIELGLNRKESFKGQRVNFLILSLDKRNDKLESTLLTDTIIFASLDTKTGRLKLIPIPRDLWINSLKTKVNSLYFYGEEGGAITGDTNGPEYLLQELSVILGQPINYWLVMDYPNLADLVDAIGGVDIKIDKGFIDNEFPNPEYVKATESGTPVYMTVEFDEGTEHMNGERALQFVRSRKSDDLEEGSDTARSDRQLILFQALMARVKSKQVIADPRKLGSLYKFWQEKVNKNLKDEDLLGILFGNKTALKSGILISTVSIPTTFDSEGEILIHPPTTKYGQWVWEPRDPTWKELREFVSKSLE